MGHVRISQTIDGFMSVFPQSAIGVASFRRKGLLLRRSADLSTHRQAFDEPIWDSQCGALYMHRTTSDTYVDTLHSTLGGAQACE